MPATSIYTTNKPYVYTIQEKSTGLKYIGYRSNNKAPWCEDLLVEYFTSSKYVKPLVQANRDDWEVLRVEEYEDKKEAWDREQELLKSITDRDNYYNRCFTWEGYINTKGTKFMKSPSGKLVMVSPEKCKDLEKAGYIYEGVMAGTKSMKSPNNEYVKVSKEKCKDLEKEGYVYESNMTGLKYMKSLDGRLVRVSPEKAKKLEKKGYVYENHLIGTKWMKGRDGKRVKVSKEKAKELEKRGYIYEAVVSGTKWMKSPSGKMKRVPIDKCKELKKDGYAFKGIASNTRWMKALNGKITRVSTNKIEKFKKDGYILESPVKGNKSFHLLLDNKTKIACRTVDPLKIKYITEILKMIEGRGKQKGIKTIPLLQYCRDNNLTTFKEWKQTFQYQSSFISYSRFYLNWYWSSCSSC